MGSNVPEGGGLRKCRIAATIANGASETDVIDLGDWVPSAIQMSAGWDTAALTLRGSFDGTNFFPIYVDGSEFSISAPAVSALHMISIPAMGALKFLKIRSGTASSPVNQTAARSLAVICSG